jgi:hypothetical protein
MTDRELMQMALYTLQKSWCGDEEQYKAIEALRDRLAQPVHAIDISQERVDEMAKHKHEWVGLTDDDYDELLETKDWGGSLIYATEAKLKEKNT